jgi:uncharacterized protein (TIGR03032 family)
VEGPSDPHDIHVDDEGLLVASSGDDCIWEIMGDRGRVVWRASDLARDEHHVNGIARDARRTVVTMFGPRRNRQWSNVVEGQLLDIHSGQILMHGIHHPHSPRLRDGQIWFCESGRGDIVVIEGSRIGRTSIGGYTRGISIGENHILVGVSSARTQSRSEGTANLISDSAGWAGVTVVDRQTLAIIDRLDLAGLGGEVFDVAFVDSFDRPIGDDAHRMRALRLGRDE